MSIHHGPDSLACSAVSEKVGYTYVFPKIIVTGTNIVKKQNLLKLLTGLSETNFVFSRVLELSFNKSNENNDFVKMGGFGGNTYKVKNLNKRLAEEDKDQIDRPFKVQIFSKNVKREYTLIVLPITHSCGGGCYSSDIIISADNDIDCNKLALEHAGKAYACMTEKTIDTIETETYEFYVDNVLRFARRQDKKIFIDIISGKTNEEIIYDCPDFVFVRDILWNNNCINNMHYIIIFKNQTYMSIRDLSGTDIPLLENAIAIGKQCIEKRHDDISKITMETYFHYHPSIWLLHIHFVSNTINENHKKYMVNDIIRNLSQDTNYYRNDIIL